MQTKNFNKKNTYDEKVKPILNELAKVCDEEEIPFFFTAAVENNDNDTVYKSEVRISEIYGYSLTVDQIAKHTNVTKGFMTVPKEQPVIIDI